MPASSCLHQHSMLASFLISASLIGKRCIGWFYFTFFLEVRLSTFSNVQDLSIFFAGDYFHILCSFFYCVACLFLNRIVRLFYTSGKWTLYLWQAPDISLGLLSFDFANSDFCHEEIFYFYIYTFSSAFNFLASGCLVKGLLTWRLFLKTSPWFLLGCLLLHLKIFKSLNLNKFIWHLFWYKGWEMDLILIFFAMAALLS